MNNSKLILSLSCLAALTLTAPLVTAAPRGGGGHHFASTPARGGQPFARGMGTWNGQRWNGGNWSGRNWSGRNWSGRNWSGRNWNNWNGNWRHHNNHNNNDVIFIGSFGFPSWWGWGYPYGYYGYGYRSSSRSRVAELQRRLARAGYYGGAIDGIIGPGTRRAIRAYERSRE